MRCGVGKDDRRTVERMEYLDARRGVVESARLFVDGGERDRGGCSEGSI